MAPNQSPNAETNVRYKFVTEADGSRRGRYIRIPKNKIEENLLKRIRKVIACGGQCLYSNKKIKVWRNRYKVIVDADESHRRREDTGGSECATPLQPLQLKNLPAMTARICSADKSLHLEATTNFRKLLSIERSYIGEVIQSGVVPRFVEFLMREDSTQLQFEAAWALTNIAAGTSEHTREVVDHGSVAIFVKLLASHSDDVREQAVWALGNIAGDSTKYRDLVLGEGALIPLLAQLNEHAKLSMVRNVAWTLSNICRGIPQPSLDQTRHALPALLQLIALDDEEVLRDACWALSYLSDGSHGRIQAVIDAKICPRLVELLDYDSLSVFVPALRTVGNIVMGNDMQTQCIIDQCQMLPCLRHLLSHNIMKSIKMEACMIISNITAGNEDQIEAVMEADLINPLLDLLQFSEFDIKKEAAWAISNATYAGNALQIESLVNLGCVKPLCDLLICPDPQIVSVCLAGLENILMVGETKKIIDGVNKYSDKILEAHGNHHFNDLMSHYNNDISERASKLINKYYNEPLCVDPYDYAEPLPVRRFNNI